MIIKEVIEQLENKSRDTSLLNFKCCNTSQEVSTLIFNKKFRKFIHKLNECYPIGGDVNRIKNALLDDRMNKYTILLELADIDINLEVVNYNLTVGEAYIKFSKLYNTINKINLDMLFKLEAGERVRIKHYLKSEEGSLLSVLNIFEDNVSDTSESLNSFINRLDIRKRVCLENYLHDYTIEDLKTINKFIEDRLAIIIKEEPECSCISGDITISELIRLLHEHSKYYHDLYNTTNKTVAKYHYGYMSCVFDDFSFMLNNSEIEESSKLSNLIEKLQTSEILKIKVKEYLSYFGIDI